MANAVYPIFKDAAYSGSANVDLTADTTTNGPYVALIDTGTYTYSAAHDFWADVTTAGGIIGTPGRIATPTMGSVANGTFDGDNVTFSAVTTTTSVEALIIYRNTGSAATARLVLYENTGVTGLPVTPNGGDITVTWNASGIIAF